MLPHKYKMAQPARLAILSVIVLLGQSRAKAQGDQQPAKTRVTVRDTIEMVQWADRGYFLGGPADGPVGLFSPDGSRFVVVIKKGNVERNTNDYSVLLFETKNVFQTSQPRVLATMSSASNREAVRQVKWLQDSRTILFLGETPVDVPQVYSLDTATLQTSKLTHHRTAVVAYDASRDGRTIVYESDPDTAKSVDTQDTRRAGIVIGSQYPSDLLIADCDPVNRPDRIDKQLFVQRGRQVTRIPSTDFLTDYLPLSVSPDGRYALLVAYVADIPPSWSEYADETLRPYVKERRKTGIPSNVQQYLLLDTESDQLASLFHAPKTWLAGGFAWRNDSRGLIVSGTYLALENVESPEVEVRRKHTFVVEVDLPTRAITKISDAPLKLARWDQDAGQVILESAAWSKKTPVETYVKVGASWSRVPSMEQVVQPENPLEVTLEQDINSAPRIFVTASASGRKSLLLDLNPQFSRFQFGRVEAVTWKGSDGHDVVGGLYLPPGYIQGERYPLVIQTHGFREDRFWIDGPWSSAFAAQALAAQDIVVLQVGGGKDGEDSKYTNTPFEGPRQMAAYEGAIDYLDARGIIDRSRVGIIGFSRTAFHVAFTLTHSKYEFLAATLSDGFDGGYVNYLLWGGADYAGVNGGPPNGTSLDSWLRNSPGFNLDKVTAAVRLEYYQLGGFLGGWQWYSGLSLLNKPVDFVWLPFATHLLVKPWERLSSQQGNVDWFAFWLKGRVGTDHQNEDEYERWRELRSRVNLPHVN